jgi:membrane protease YdiL (CAAX protease family)
MSDVSLHAEKSPRIQSLRGGSLKPARFAAAALVYCAILLALWSGFHRSAHFALTGINLPRAFASFALLLAPLWFLGFGAAEPLKALGVWARILGAGFLALPYFVFALGTADFEARAAVIVVAFPILVAAFLELPHLPREMTWRDLAVLIIVAAAYFLRWLQGAWPYPALAVFSKIFLADVVVYCFLVVRKIDGAGYDLVPTLSALITGLRGWAFYLPIAFVVGELTGFIHFNAALPSGGKVVAAIIITFLLVALPEELFFRAVLQNLLETRVGKTAALLLAALLFGLSHFNHGATFNWKYVLLASIAGVFYGRAWREHRQIFAAIVTHTGVDVVWSLWFR